MDTPQKHRFTIQSVGCKVNQIEAAMLAGQMEARGWQQTEAGQDPDLVLVHTCTVTQRADRDSRRFITQTLKQYPQAMIAVSGCLAEMEKQALLAMPNVVTVIDQADRSRAAELIHRALNHEKAAQGTPAANDGFFLHKGNAVRQEKSRAMIKIEDGCDGECTFCRVRLARGKPVSRPEQDILDEFGRLVASGFQEIVITGVNIGCWQPGLARLLPKLLAFEGTYRIRLSSLEPQHLTEELIHTLARADRKVCPHLHLPLQSGDDAVLRAMARTYTSAQFRERVNMLRSLRPDYVLTGDVIVGFPGETREAFDRTCELIKACNMVRLHVFPFSARPGTRAAGMDGQVLQREITQRAKQLRVLGRELQQAYFQSRIGTPTEILLEKELAPGFWVGTNETYDRAAVRMQGKRGMLVDGCIDGQDKQGLLVSRGGAC